MKLLNRNTPEVRSCVVGAFLGLPSSQPVIVIPKIIGRNLLGVRLNEYTEEQRHTLIQDLGKLFVQDYAVGIVDRLVGNKNPANVMVFQENQLDLPHLGLVPIDNYIPASDKLNPFSDLSSVETKAIECIKAFLQGMPQGGSFIEQYDDVIRSGVTQGLQSLREFSAVSPPKDVELNHKIRQKFPFLGRERSYYDVVREYIPCLKKPESVIDEAETHRLIDHTDIRTEAEKDS